MQHIQVTLSGGQHSVKNQKIMHFHGTSNENHSLYHIKINVYDKVLRETGKSNIIFKVAYKFFYPSPHSLTTCSLKSMEFMSGGFHFKTFLHLPGSQGCRGKIFSFYHIFMHSDCQKSLINAKLIKLNNQANVSQLGKVINTYLLSLTSGTG